MANSAPTAHQGRKRMSGQIGGNDLWNGDGSYSIRVDDTKSGERPRGNLKRPHMRKRLAATFGGCLHPGRYLSA